MNPPLFKLLAGLLVALSVTAPARAEQLPDPATLAALHWHPDTAFRARALTAAVALVLTETDQLDRAWPGNVEARRLVLERLDQRANPEWIVTVDGQFGALVLDGEMNRLGEVAVARGRLPAGAWERGIPADATAPYAAAELLERAALEPGRVWEELQSRLAGAEGVPEIPGIWWSGLLGAWSEAGPGPARDYARSQAAHVQGLALDDFWSAALGDIHLTRIDWLWTAGRPLAATWRMLDYLHRVVDHQPVQAAALSEWLGGRDDVDHAELRRIDSNLPVVLEVIADSAADLAAGEPVGRVRRELGHAYARLALFLPDADYYLDQPVRRDVIQSLRTCVDSGSGPEPPGREAFETCLEGLFGQINHALGTEELTGGASGAYAEEFLRREMELPTWQRIDYLRGHLNWLLGGECPSSSSINWLEWSLLTELLGRWAPLRPVYFGVDRWREALEQALELGLNEAGEVAETLGCLVPRPARSEVRDVFARLLRLHRDELRLFEQALNDALDRFRDTHLKPGADVSLEPGLVAGQPTAYRPEGLLLGPCDPARSCGAQIALPVSRALVGLFPNPYLLADQLRMGDLQLCYDRVGWVERRQVPARPGDPEVANFLGYFSFDLVGRFTRPDAPGVFDEGDDDGVLEVFRLRLVDDQERHYLFSAADPELLELECPLEKAGEPVHSRRPDDSPGLVPRRLTYFSSTPITPERLLAANWGRGSEWRDWFITGNRVESIEQLQGDALMDAVNVRLAALSQRRERELYQRLLRPPTTTDRDPLAEAVTRLGDSTALMRRTAELFYPVQIRHDPVLRGALAGDQGLISRERLRLLRDAEMPVQELSAVGRGRLEGLQVHWYGLPAVLKSRGQAAPELVRGIDRLRRLSARRPEAAAEARSDQNSRP